MSQLVTPDLSGPVPVALVAGEVDLANTTRLRKELRALATDEAGGLVVDLSGVPYMDSAGVKTLFELASDLRQRKLSLVVTVPGGSAIRRLLKITNFSEVAPICDDVETAFELVAKGLGE